MSDADDRRTSDWFEVPKEVIDDLELPEKETEEIKGGAVDYFVKIEGQRSYLKLSASPTLIKQSLQGYKY